MAIFYFKKNAGEDLSEEEDVQNEEQMITMLQNYINKLDLRLDDVRIRIDGEKVYIAGDAITQDSREKAIVALGNIYGIAEVEEEIEVRVTGEVSDLYTVKIGDTLSKIAREHYGDDYQYNRIFTANQPMLHDPDDIYPGMVLRLPKGEK